MRLFRQRLGDRLCRDRFDHGGVFGQGDQLGAGVAGAPHQRQQAVDVGADLATGGELDAGGLEPPAHAAVPRSGSSLPALSSAWSSSEPPTCWPLIQICGTVDLPFASAFISARLAGLKVTSISSKVTP